MRNFVKKPPGLDLRGDGGYVVVPPSLHETGVAYEWVVTPDDTPLADAPDWLQELIARPNSQPTTQSLRVDTDGSIPDGRRNATLYSYARRLKAQNLSYAEVDTAVTERNQSCEPPLPEDEVAEIVRKAMTQPNRPDFLISQPAPALEVPDAGLIGLGKEFADLYSAYLESPRAFLYFAFLTYFGALISKKVTLDSELSVQPRLYTVLLGESAATRKSTALAKAHEFFRSLEPDQEPPVVFGVGSAEGLGREIQRCPDGTLIVHLDEMKSFVDKAKIDGSVLLPMINQLFDRHDYDNRTKHESIQIRDSSLSLVAACTKDTYARIFSPQFRDIGFFNRLWLVADSVDQRIAIPEKVDEVRRTTLRESLKELLRTIDTNYRENGSRPVPYGFTPGARQMFQEWYERREGSIFEDRLDTYGHQLSLLLTVTSEKTEVDEEVMTATLALLQWQLDVRRECDPLDAETTIGRLEEKIRRALQRGPVGKTELKRRCNYSRFGLWTWDTAINNLMRGEVDYDPKRGLYSLRSASGRASVDFAA